MQLRKVVLWLLCVSSAAPAFAMRVHLRDSKVVVSEARPGGTIVLFGVVREARGYHTRVHRHHFELIDDDRNGTIEAAVSGPTGPRAIWIAVDTDTGVYVAFSPEEHPLRRAAPGGGFIRGAAAGARSLVFQRSTADIVLVRPHHGVWKSLITDGGEADEDGRNDGSASLNVASFRSIATGGPPAARIEAGDLVLAIDSSELDFFAGTVAK